MPDWLRSGCAIVFLVCVPPAAATYLVIEFGHPGLDRPSPGGVRQRQHEGYATEYHDDSRAGQNNAQSVPFVQDQQAQDQNPVASKAKNEGNWYANPDWWVAGFTCALFIATSALWAFTALLWLSTKKLVMDEEKAINAAFSHVAETARAAKAMENVAAEMAKNAKASLASAQLAQQEFASTHRPRLYIRSINARVLNPDQKIAIRFTVFNKGELGASGIVWRVGSIVLDKDKHVYELEGVDAVNTPFIYPLLSGMDHTEDFESPRMLSADDHDSIIRGRKALFFCGVILYQDSSGNARRSGFTRRYDAATRQFVPTGDYDADYEY